MDISIDRNSKIALYIQIKNQIRNKIYSKKYIKNYPLLPERKLAKELGVDRSTVVKAYQELKSEGLIDSKIGKGTYVVYSDERAAKNKSDIFTRPLFWDEIYNKGSRKNYDDSISRIMNTDTDKKIISFSGGIPCDNIFPTEEFRNIIYSLLENKVGRMFSHSPVAGDKELRKEIKNLMIHRGIKVFANEIMITSGSQQGLDFLVRTFINDNDVILVEEPTFFGAIQLFKSLGATVIGVPVDENGICIDILEYLINKHNPKFIYTIPNFQNPTGIIMSLKRRCELLRISAKYSIPIIEDDPYGEIIYEGDKLPTLKSLDKDNYVIYLSTFSKVISLGLRVGWIIAPQGVINKLSLLKQLTDLHVNTLSQNVILEFLSKGYYEIHIEKVKREYIAKRNLMVYSLNKNFQGDIKFSIPRGGFYIWCETLKNIDSSILLKKSIKNGVDFIPGKLFFYRPDISNRFFRLNFTYPTREEIVKGTKILRDTFCELIRDT